MIDTTRIEMTRLLEKIGTYVQAEHMDLERIVLARGRRQPVPNPQTVCVYSQSKFGDMRTLEATLTPRGAF